MVSDVVPAPTPAGSVPNSINTDSSSSFTVSCFGVKMTVFAVSPASKVTLVADKL